MEVQVQGAPAGGSVPVAAVGKREPQAQDTASEIAWHGMEAARFQFAGACRQAVLALRC